MPEPSIPPPLEQFGPRPFSFYPPIRNIEHNEWMYEEARWSEIRVRNAKTRMDLWVPRRYLGEVSSIDEPVMIVGLLKELEYAAGAVIPHERRLISMPKAATGPAPASTAGTPHPPGAMAGMHLDSPAESRIGKLIIAALVLGVLGCFLVISIYRGRVGDRVEYHPIFQANLGLGASDDYFAVVRKLGTPSGEAWLSEEGALQYRAVKYTDYTVILMGTERDKTRYIGALNREWKPIDSVLLPDGRNTASMLRSLKRF